MKGEWIAEPVEFSCLRPGVAFYLENPLVIHNQLPHYTCENLPSDQIVWTLYEPWRKINPWIKKECRVDKLPGNAASGLINNLESDWF